MGWHGERWAAQSGKHHRLYLFVYDTWLRGTVNVRPRAPRDSPRSRRQSPVRRRARGRRDLSCSWAPDPRHVSRCRAAALPRGLAKGKAWRVAAMAAAACLAISKSRTIPMFRLTRSGVRTRYRSASLPALTVTAPARTPRLRRADRPVVPRATAYAIPRVVPTGPTNARARCAIVIDTRSSPPRDLYCMELYRLCDGHTTRRGIG